MVASLTFCVALAPLLTVAVGSGTDCADYTNYNFEAYLSDFGKSYKAEDHKQRRVVFEDNLKKVIAHNEEYKAGNQTWYAAINHFADWTSEEFKQLQTAKYHFSQTTVAQFQIQEVQVNPKQVDWRLKGAATPVKNQGGCGSCWAFAAAETVESAYYIASGKLLQLAPQTYVNCVKNPNECGGTGGCEGATMELAFNLTTTTGIALESDMHYKARDAQCTAYNAAVKSTGYVKNPVNDAGALETAVATKGPIAITVAATPWQVYGGGVFSGCSTGRFASAGSELNHGVQLVGYTEDYWIVRNSWGEFWGEKGYIRLSRAMDAKTFVDKRPQDGVACKPYPKTQVVGGECGLLFDTSYPTGVTAATTTVVV